mgnify:CR=1 FL=1
MDRKQQAQLESFGFIRIYTGTGLKGSRLWYKRTGTELAVVRQPDGAIKTQDLSGFFEASCPLDTHAANRQWAIDMAVDPLTEWQCAIELEVDHLQAWLKD